MTDCCHPVEAGDDGDECFCYGCGKRWAWRESAGGWVHTNAGVTREQALKDWADHRPGP